MSAQPTAPPASADLLDVVLRLAAEEGRSPDSVIEDLLCQECALAAEEARPITLTTAEAAPPGTLLRDDEETEAEYASRSASFATLVGRR